MLSVREGDLETVQRILKSPVDVNAKDNYENTALHHAVLMNRLEILVCFFLDPRVDFLAKNNRGATAHQIMSSRNLPRTETFLHTKILLEHSELLIPLFFRKITVPIKSLDAITTSNRRILENEIGEFLYSLTSVFFGREIIQTAITTSQQELTLTKPSAFCAGRQQAQEAFIQEVRKCVEKDANKIPIFITDEFLLKILVVV